MYLYTSSYHVFPATSPPPLPRFSCHSFCLQGIINLILATDMARHSEILADFDKTVAGGFSFSNAEHIKMVSILHVPVKVCIRTSEEHSMTICLKKLNAFSILMKDVVASS